MKRLITHKTWLCRLTLVLGCLAIAMAVHAANITVDGINYTTASDGKATIAKYTIIKATAESPADTLFYTGDIVIPEKFTYEGVEYTVVATAANAFLNCKNLTSVQLPATCVTIARNSFKGCTKLATSPIPMTATSVGTGVFNGCSSLEEVTIMSGWSKPISEEFANCPNLKRLIIAEGSSPLVMKVTAFGATIEARSALKSIEYIYMGRNVDASAYTNNEQPFHNMTNLMNLVIGGETTTIQGTTFQGCTALNTITFNEGNKMSNIGSSTFENCTSLTSINIPSGVTVIEQNLFNNCQNLKNVTLSDGVTSIGNSAFKNTGLTSFHFPYALTSIGESAFENSKLSGDIELPGLLTTIGTQAFANTSLHGVTIPASVTDIGNGAFAPIATLASISLNGGNTSFRLDNGVLLSAASTRLLVSAHEGNIGTSYSNATVTTIDNYGLAHAPFTTVYLPALASIGNYGFAYSDLETFTLESVITVGVNVFMGSALNEIVIAEGRNEIPQGLCSQCTNLTSVTLPTTATNMMSNCFEGCTALEVMEIPANVNYMEPGSVPATIKELRVLNTNPPVLANGVFNENQHDVICKVAPSSVSLFENASQWYFLNIVADESISSDDTMLGCPDGLYYATTNGDLMYRDLNGSIVNTNFKGQHAFTLQSYKNRVYVAVAGQRFTYQDPNQPLGDGGLFYVNNSNGIFYRVNVLNNVGYAPNEDPFTMFIDENENKIYISDRNVGIHEMNADATGLYGQQPYLLQNQWLPYYNDELSWGSITGGFTLDKHGIFWMSKKFNGVCLLRFTKDDIYPSGGAGKPKSYSVLFKDAIIKTFYLDEENGYLYMQVQTDPYGCVPGIYRIGLNRIENQATGADVVGNENLRIADCELIDDSPIKVEGVEDSGELANVAQITGDGEYIYWSYIAPASDAEAIRKSVPLNTNNPLHHSGIKCLKATPNDDGTMPTTVTFAVEGVEAYGVCAMNYSPYITPELEQTVEPSFNYHKDDLARVYYVEIEQVEPSTISYRILLPNGEWTEWTEYSDVLSFTENGIYRIEAFAIADGKRPSETISLVLLVDFPLYTDMPTISAEETDNAVIVTATGDGEVKLYLDGVEVENPYVIPKQEQTMTYNFTATAQEEGCHISNEASLTVTVPGYGSSITVYVKADRAPHLFSWVPDGNGSWIYPLGDWPGSVMSNIMTVNRVQYYTYTFDPYSSVNIILDNGSGGFGNQTGDFVNITEDAYFVYNGGGLAYGVIPPTVYGNPTGEYAFYVNTDHWSKVNAVLDGVSYPMTLVGTDGAGYEVYKWENNMITAPSTITFNDGAGNQVVDATGYVYSSDYVKGGYYIYTFFASKQYASLDMPTVITYEGEDQRPVLEDCVITLKSSNEVWNSYNDVSFDITGTYFNPAARQGRALYSVDGGDWVEFTPLLNSEQRFAQNVTLSFNPDVTRHTIRLAAQDLSGTYSAIVTVLEVTDAKALQCYDLPELEYTGEPLTFEPRIYDPYSYQQLTLGEDYTVSFSNNVNVGPASMNVQAIYPAYIGETTFTYAIIPHPISGEAYVVGGPFYYNGNAFTPDVVVIDDLLGELTPGEDYTVTYINNVEIGEAIALVEGIGRCTGEIAVTFEILDPPMNERDWNIIKQFYSQYQNDLFVWNVDDPLSAKYNPGLTVENERVIGIELPEQGLEGGFPTMLLSLDELRTLDLSYNNLSGDAASDMAQYAAAEGITATGLQNLYINNNEFTGNVGQMAALFVNLTNLNVSANHFDKVYPMVNPGVNLSLSEQLLEMDADITPGIESLITSIPTICLYDHAAQTFLTNLGAQLTDQSQSPVWNMDLSFSNGAFNMYTSSPYRGLNGQILDGYTWLNSSWYNEQLLKVKFIFAPGDANINGPVDITDLQAMVNYIFGEYNRPFNYTAANLNNDNTVNVQDVVGEANLLLSMDLTMAASGPGRAPVLEATTPQASLYWEDGVLYLNTSVPVAALDIVNNVSGDIKWNVANRGMVVKTARGAQGEHTVIYSLGDAVIPPGLTAIATTTSPGAMVVAAKLSDTDAELVKIQLNDRLTRLIDLTTDGNVQCQLDGNSLIIISVNPLDDVNIGIYTIDGKVITDKHLPHLDSGKTRISMSEFDYSNGYLIIVVRNGRQVIATQKLTQIK